MITLELDVPKPDSVARCLERVSELTVGQFWIST